jgi:hypothetical protein
VIDDFVKWVSLGAPDPRTEDASTHAHGDIAANPRRHWAYQAPQRAAPPGARHSSWVRTDSDRFILAKSMMVGGAHPISLPAKRKRLLPPGQESFGLQS